MTQALIWLDEEGGIIWLRHKLRWLAEQSFTWTHLLETPLLLPVRTEVSIISGLSGERLVCDVLPKMRPWERHRMIRQKMAAHCSETPYVDGWLAGRLNALQFRLSGIALPREYVDSLLMHLDRVQADCKKILPASMLFSRLTQKKGFGTVLWVVLYRRMHLYFVDENGLRLSRTLDTPSDLASLIEEVKKIHRYALGQKWLSVGDRLVVRYLVLTTSLIVEQLPVLDGIKWQRDHTTLSMRQLWQHDRGQINCLPLYLRRAYYWRYWNRLAWRAMGLMMCGMVGIGGSRVMDYLAGKQQLQQLQMRTTSIEQSKKLLGKTARTLLDIASYQQKHAYPNYEGLLLQLSHILNDFPGWYLESIEWQQHAPHKIRLVGRWQTLKETEQVSARFERALTRQLQAKQVHITSANPESGQTIIEVNFDMAGEEG
jgi:hypothetical protein